METVLGSIFNGANLGASYFNLFDTLEGKVEKIGNAIETTDHKLTAAKGVIRYKTLLAELQRKQEQAGGSNKRLAEGIKAVEQRYKDAKRSAKSYGLNIGNIAQEHARLDRSSVRLRGRLNRLNRAQRATQAAGDGQGGGMLGMTNIYGGITQAIGQSMAFQRELSLLGNTRNLGSEELDSLRTELKQISGEVNQDKSSLLAGVDVFIGEGFKSGQATEAMRHIGKTATATGTSILELSKTSAASFKNMELTPDGFAGALDTLVASSEAGGLKLQEMVQHFPQLTVKAKELGLAGKEGIATLGSGFQVAMKGAADPKAAAENFNAFLSQLSDPSTLARFKKMGIDIQQELDTAIAAGKDPILEMVKLIEQKTGGDKLKIGELLGDKKAVDFFNPMLENLDEFEKIKQSALSGEGVIDQDFSNMMGTAAAQMKRFQLVTSNIGDTFATSLLPSITPVIEKIATVMSWVAKGVEKYPVLGRLLGGLAAGFAVFATGLAVVTAAQMAFNTALLVNPITWVVGGIIIGASLIMAFWEPLSGFFGDLWQGIKEAFASPWETIKSLFSFTPLGLIINNWQAITGFFGRLWQGIQTIFSAAWQGIKLLFSFTPLGLIINNWQAITGFFGRLWQGIQTIFSTAWQGIKLLFSFTPLGLIINNWQAITGFFGALWQGVKTIFSTAWQGIKSFLSFNPIALVMSHWQPLKAFFSDLWSGIMDQANIAFDWLIKKFEGITNFISDKWQQLKGWFFGEDEADENTNKAAKPSPVKPKALIKPVVVASSMAVTPLGVAAHQPSADPTNYSYGHQQKQNDFNATLHGVQQATSASQYQTQPVNISAPITVHAAPGMDEQEIARQIDTQLQQRERQAQAQQRAALYDLGESY